LMTKFVTACSYFCPTATQWSRQLRISGIANSADFICRHCGWRWRLFSVPWMILRREWRRDSTIW
jgi:hypothetical protein